MKLPADIKRFIMLVLFFGCATVIPLWKHPDKLEHPMTGFILLIFLFTPTLTAVYVSFMNGEPNKLSLFALQLGDNWKLHSFYQWFFWPVVAFLSLVIGNFLGLYQLDFQFSGFDYFVTDSINTFSDTSGQPLIKLPLSSVQIAYCYLFLLLFSPLVLGLVTIGQELAWRGWFLSKLLHLGPLKAILISNLVWGIWYAPIALLGYRYAGYSLLSALFTLVFCMVVGTILSWSRLKTDSILPPIIGHAAINGSIPITHIFAAKGSDVNLLFVGINGIIGWVIPILIIIVLLKRDAFALNRPFIEQRR
jgi:uncharacterized protein